MPKKKLRSEYKFTKTIFGKLEKIPNEWKIELIKTITEKLVVGFVGICEPYYTEKNGIPMIRTTNVKEGILDLSNLKYVTKEFHERNKKSQIKKFDILISRHGESGEAALVRELEDANCLNIVIIRANTNLILPEFLESMINSTFVRKQIKRAAAGGVQGVVNTSEIAKTRIYVPPIPEQEKISFILSHVESIIQRTQEIIQQIQKLKQGLLQKLIHDSSGWEKRKLGDICDIFDFKRIPLSESERSKKQGKIPYYGASGIIDHIDDFIFNEKLLCFSEDGENLRSRVLPIAFTIDGKTWVNNHAHVLKPKKEIILHDYLESFLNSIKLDKFLGFTAQPKLNQKDMKQIPIILPSIKKQQSISNMLSNTNNQLKLEIQYKFQLENLKKGLMQKLLTGQIRVI